MRLFLLGLVLAALPASVEAQDGRCYDGFPLGFVLPDSTLAYLDTIAESRYAQAFLLQLLLDRGVATHPLVIEARRFEAAPADSVAGWFALAPSSADVLCALRTEAERRDDLLRLGGKIGSALRDLTDAAGRPVERLAELGPGLRQLREDLRDDTSLPAVPALGRFIVQSDTARSRLLAYAGARATRDQAARAVAAVCPTGVVVDSTNVAFLSPQCDAARADSAAAFARFENAHQRFEAYRDTAVTALDDLGAALSDAESASVTGRAAITTLTVRTPGTRASARQSASPPEAAVPTVAPLTQTAPPRPPDAILFALTDFLIARAQEEVVTTYLAGAHRWFDEPAVRFTFPDTRALAEGVIDDDLPVPLSMWRTTLVADFRAFPRRLITDDSLGFALLGSRYATLRPDFVNVSVVVGLAEALADGTPPLALLERLPVYADSIRLGQPWTARVRAASQLASALASDYQTQGLRTFDATGLGRQPGYVLSVAQLLGQASGQDELYARLLLAAVFRPNNPSPVDPAALGVTGFDFPALHDGLATVLHTIETTLRQVETLGDGEQDDYAVYIDTALEQLTALLDLARAHGGDAAATDLDVLVDRWDRVTTLYTDLHQRAYADALTNALLLFHDLTDSTAVPTRFFQVASLAASVASAQNGTQLQSAFRAAALPTGSRRAKREGEGSAIYLNAYLGGAAGAERVLGDPAGSDEPWAGALAVALPIGVEARLGRSGFSVFGSLIDLGALASFRLRADSSSVASGFPEANLGQVIAPGLYLTWGVPSQPFALGLGVQLAPALRRIQSDGMEDERADVVRLGAFVGVDLPLLGF